MNAHINKKELTISPKLNTVFRVFRENKSEAAMQTLS